MINQMLVKDGHVVVAFPPAASPASTEDAVSMKQYDRCAIVLFGDNGTSVTGATVTLKQSTAVALTGEKALSFTTYYANADISSSDTLTATTATSNTFTTTTTANANWLYVIEVKAEDLDVANSFDVLRVDVTGNANCVIGGLYVLYRSRFAGGTPQVSAITD